MAASTKVGGERSVMKDVFSLAGRKALVTGGSRGIGWAIVELFSDHGAEVAFYHYRDEKNALQRVEKLSEASCGPRHRMRRVRRT